MASFNPNVGLLTSKSAHSPPQPLHPSVLILALRHQTTLSLRPIGPDEYDAATRHAPASCPLFAIARGVPAGGRVRGVHQRARAWAAWAAGGRLVFGASFGRVVSGAGRPGSTGVLRLRGGGCGGSGGCCSGSGGGSDGGGLGPLLCRPPPAGRGCPCGGGGPAPARGPGGRGGGCGRLGPLLSLALATGSRGVGRGGPQLLGRCVLRRGPGGRGPGGRGPAGRGPGAAVFDPCGGSCLWGRSVLGRLGALIRTRAARLPQVRMTQAGPAGAETGRPAGRGRCVRRASAGDGRHMADRARKRSRRRPA